MNCISEKVGRNLEERPPAQQHHTSTEERSTNKDPGGIADEQGGKDGSLPPGKLTAAAEIEPAEVPKTDGAARSETLAEKDLLAEGTVTGPTLAKEGELDISARPSVDTLPYEVELAKTGATSTDPHQQEGRQPNADQTEVAKMPTETREKRKGELPQDPHEGSKSPVTRAKIYVRPQRKRKPGKMAGNERTSRELEIAKDTEADKAAVLEACLNPTEKRGLPETYTSR